MQFKSFSLASCLLAISCLSACTESPNQTDLVINNVTVVCCSRVQAYNARAMMTSTHILR